MPAPTSAQWGGRTDDVDSRMTTVEVLDEDSLWLWIRRRGTGPLLLIDLGLPGGPTTVDHQVVACHVTG